MSFNPSFTSLNPTKGEMRKMILEVGITTQLLELFKSNNDAVKYCASQALITLDGGRKGFHFILPLLMIHPGDPRPSIPASDITACIAWLVRTVGSLWRYRRTVKFLSEIIKNGKVTQP